MQWNYFVSLKCKRMRLCIHRERWFIENLIISDSMNEIRIVGVWERTDSRNGSKTVDDIISVTFERFFFNLLHNTCEENRRFSFSFVITKETNLITALPHESASQKTVRTFFSKLEVSGKLCFFFLELSTVVLN